MALYPDAPYEYASSAGRLIFAAGACPIDEAGTVVEPGDLVAQADRTVDNLLAALDGVGVGAEDIVKMTIFVATTERADLVRVWNVVAPRLGRAPNTLLGVTVLGYEHQLVEIEAIARAPVDTTR